MKTQFLLTTATLFACLTGHTQDLMPDQNRSAQSQDAVAPNSTNVQNGMDMFFTADFIWWKFTQEGLTYALTGIRANKNTTVSTQGSEHTPNFSWEPGFKVGLGFKLPHDHWDIYFQYSWIQSLDNKSIAERADANIQEGYSLGALNFDSATIEQITKATSKWDAHFNVLNFELGRTFTVSDSFLLRPFGGLKATWQDQKWDNTYIGKVHIDGGPSAGTVTSNHDHDTWGMGIRTGLNGQWLFNRHFGLFANTALSAMWTDYDVDRKDVFENSTATVKAIHIKRDDYSVRGVVELLLGMKAQWWPSNGRYRIALHLAYEQQVWVNYGSYIFFSDTNNDLSMHGLNASMRIDF